MHNNDSLSPNVRRWLCAATSGAVALACLQVLPAHAAAPEETPTEEPAAASPDVEAADALSEQAVERFNARDFDNAIDLFKQAYALDAKANYLFNIGRVFEEKGDLQSAVDFYQRFVGSESVDLESRQNATERISVLRETLRAMEGDAEPDDPDPDPDPVGEPTTTEPTDTGPDRKRVFRIAGYSLMGVGGVALIAGGVFGGLALGKRNDADEEPLVDEALSLRDDAKSQAKVADALFITGGVLATAGLIFVLTTLGKKDKGAATARTNVSPFASRRAAGLSLSGRF